MYYIELIMDIIFGIDILLNFNTGYYYKGTIIMKRSKVILNYISTWFVMDILASFPYDLVIEVALTSQGGNSSLSQYSDAPQLLRMLKLIRFLRILRLLRVMKLKRLLYKLEEFMITDFLNTVMDFAKLLILVFFITHWMACTFYFVGDYEKTTNPDNWITINGFDIYPKFDQYIMTLYFSFTTMATVGYGDITPNTGIEKIYCMFAMMIACGFSAYLIGSMGSIFNRSNMLANEYKLKSLYINQFLNYHNIPNEFKIKIMTYMEYLIEYKKTYKLEENQVLEMLNENLRDQVILYLNGKILMECSCFDYFSPNLLSELTFILSRKMFAVDDCIFDEGVGGERMYFVTKGIFASCSNLTLGNIILYHIKTHTFIKEIKEGSILGERGFFTNHKRMCSARSKEFTEVLLIEKTAFTEIVERYPEEKLIIKKRALIHQT